MNLARRPHATLAAVVILSLAVVSCLTKTTRAAEASALATAVASIQEKQLQSHVDTLADDAFEGREAGSRGGRAASTYLMKKLEACGLAGAGDRGGYFQSFKNYRNVLAVLPGGDDALQDEYILVGAHFDHVGYGTRSNSNGSPGYIHNGADDNASGTAALLEVAEAFTKLPEAPRRSVLFAFWDAEEKGLLGSEHWIRNPTVPLRQVKLNVNVDMVGRLRDEKVIVYGTRTAPGLRRLMTDVNRHTDFRLSFVWWINPQSDHYTFVQRNIPVVMLHTGLHNDYHRPSDDVHRLDVAGIHRISHLLFHTSLALANRTEVPAFRKRGAWESTTHRRRFEQQPAPAPPRLGVTWREPRDDEETAGTEEEADGLTLTSVAEGSAAEKAGLKVGDRVLFFDGIPIRDGGRFRRAVMRAGSTANIVVRKPGSNDPVTLPVELSGRPVRLGVSWRENAAEPSAVTIVQVAADSPAEQAGIRRLDRIYAIDGHEFADGNQLQQRLKSALSGPFDLTLDRDGRLLEVRVYPDG